ncbi:conidiation-specific protein 10 [Aspergillus lentulus]|uniref:Conidiation-specific protein 10 n=1 Tax=Aspergillus lentulus TaxID=293939 RepID=A0AAN5YNH0_ASPLE|nr:conidiation-specific protein 10 [Aspergillus lentulus]KAF4155811.1 hypothetical protein CNMCM6069_007572 [Aspergillus lentulus]KAF4166254.1 hypothetical protein CNMCM6936_006675 [Aspergillus lentulus]KAF4176820.1 hypothetical protein CNMCM8060_005924 [Aspergillus lentulus]KAF4188492.1 hypothetical protein CNMCM7927_001698 [Aspergillus lentulus]KAF4197172.1 hypothetical protein CNMCM8694_003660 [Aspergillus lentulus]
MQRSLFRPHLSNRLGRSPSLWRTTAATVTTRADPHPNPGNFANRPKEELSEIGRKGGRKGGRARGVGGFHDMDPEKQHEIASRGGRATRNAAEQAEKHQGVAGERRRTHDPSAASPGFEESWTA